MKKGLSLQILNLIRKTQMIHKEHCMRFHLQKLPLDLGTSLMKNMVALVQHVQS